MMGAMRGSKQESSWCCRQPQETGGSCYSLARSDRNTENQGWVYPVPGMVFVVPVVFFFSREGVCGSHKGVSGSHGVLGSRLGVLGSHQSTIASLQ